MSEKSNDKAITYISYLKVDELLFRDRHCVVEACALVFDIGLRNLIDLRRGKAARDHMDRPHRNTG